MRIKKETSAKNFTSVLILSAPGKLLYQLLWDLVLCWEREECGLDWTENPEAVLLHRVPLLAIMLEVMDSKSSISSFVLNLLIGGALKTVWTGLFTHSLLGLGPSNCRCWCPRRKVNCSLHCSLSSGALSSQTSDQLYLSPPPPLFTRSLSCRNCFESLASNWSSR